MVRLLPKTPASRVRLSAGMFLFYFRDFFFSLQFFIVLYLLQVYFSFYFFKIGTPTSCLPFHQNPYFPHDDASLSHQVQVLIVETLSPLHC